jgi:cytochrome c biogenesis protein
MLGTCAAMFFRHRRIWVRVLPAGTGSEVRFASPDRPDPTFRSRFDEVVAAVGGTTREDT